MIKNILFDLDGTLTDPALGITSCYQYALKKMGAPVLPAEELHWCIGPPLSFSFVKLFGTDDESQINRAIFFYRERFSDKGLFENELIEGIPELLDELHQAGLKLFVATSKPTIYASQIIDHFGLSKYFEGIFGSELDGTNSFKPDLLKFILAECELSSQETIMIGDRYHDIEGAKANGVASVAVSWGYGSEAEFENAGPDHVCQQPSDILAVIGA